MVIAARSIIRSLFPCVTVGADVKSPKTNMADLPSREEILEKYKDVITAKDFKLLVADAPPPPEELQRENVFVEYWGKFKGFAVWAKKTAAAVLIALIFIHDGWETYRDFAPIAIRAYSEVVRYGQRVAANAQLVADRYIAFIPETKSPVPQIVPGYEDFIAPATGIYPISRSLA